jgi:predicted acylesterase/phospholipase RssA
MKKIGLALSGGGFRATLYHLGLIRFLRDADILRNVTDITAVSGGSIMAAHLGLNWGRYNGSPSEFDAAANELLDFIRVDVRNRILRRYPFGLLFWWPRRLVGLSNRKLTRTGLLEYHYEKYLFGDVSLFQLPEKPRLHLLATNLSEGRLCSFNRLGLWILCRESGHGFRIDHKPIGLATIPMAVAASSAFPGFFPPSEMTGADVGASEGEFGRQAYTDGGVFDNLGVRMFHYLAQLPQKKLSWDSVLVSDVGKPFEILSHVRAGGLIRTAMRASDILMDRVWQLENERFEDTPGFLFARITDIVDSSQDPAALHPEVQRQLPSIRTDLDRFSDIEMRNLIHHGYCVGRQTCRSRPDVFGSDLPTQPPWIPNSVASPPTTVSTSASQPVGLQSEPTTTTKDARTLHASAFRRIWSKLLDYRDWVSYVYVPIIVPILVFLPYAVVKYYERSHRISQIVDSLAQGSRDLEQMKRLMEGPVTRLSGDAAEELKLSDKIEPKGFTILQDSRIVDLRNWKPSTNSGKEVHPQIYGYRRLKVLKSPENAGNNEFHVSVLAASPETQVYFPPQRLKPRMYSKQLENSATGQKLVHWIVGVDFRKVPAGDTADILYEHMSPGSFLRDGIDSTTLAFEIEVDTVELTRWLMMPQGREYREYRLIRYETGKPETTENVQIVTEYLAEDYTILAFKLLSLKAGYTYELTWFYR